MFLAWNYSLESELRDGMGFDIDGKDIRLALVEKIVELEG